MNGNSFAQVSARSYCLSSVSAAIDCNAHFKSGSFGLLPMELCTGASLRTLLGILLLQSMAAENTAETVAVSSYLPRCRLSEQMNSHSFSMALPLFLTRVAVTSSDIIHDVTRTISIEN